MKNITFNTFQIGGLKMSAIKKMPWTLASHAFLVILLLIFLDLLLGGFLFYQYIVLANSPPSAMAGINTQFEYATYQKVLEEVEAKQQNFQKPLDEKYTNPFSAL